MATIRDGNTSALIVIDLQNGVIANAHDRDGVVARTATLIERAREENVPVIFVQHEDEELVPDTDAWQIVSKLSPREGDVIVRKRYQDAFEDTILEDTLSSMGVSHVVIAGAQTDACIRFSSHRALAEGYDMTLVSDCHTTDDIDWAGVSVKAADTIAHTNLVYQFASYPGRQSTVSSHEEVTFGGPVVRQEIHEHVAD